MKQIKEESKPKKKVEPFIWGLLLGMFIQLFIIGIVISFFQKQLWWMVWNKEEVTWCIDRHTLTEQARKAVFEDSKLDGVTIIKPQSMQ